MDGFMDFTGKRILVAGASSGIGKDTAIRLSELGADVILVARREQQLQEVLHALDEGKHNAYYVADLSQLDSIESLFKQIRDEQGALDGMVYTAGIGSLSPLNLFTPEKLKNMFTINFFAFIECVRQACKKGRYNDGMRIVGVSSVASYRGDKGHLGYSASKSAMDSAVRCIAKEVADKGIGINTVAPAMTETPMLDIFRSKCGENSSFSAQLERQYLGLVQTTDVANVIAFLLSPSARMMTGLTIPIDGGLTTT